MSLEFKKILGVYKLSYLMLAEGSEQEGQDAVLCNHVFKPGRCFCANDPSRPSIRRQQANGDTAFVQKRGRPPLKIQRQLHTKCLRTVFKITRQKIIAGDPVFVSCDDNDLYIIGAVCLSQK